MFFVIQTFILNTSGYSSNRYEIHLTVRYILLLYILLNCYLLVYKYNSQSWYGPPIQLRLTNLRCICLKDYLSPHKELTIFINNSQVILLTFIKLNWDWQLKLHLLKRWYVAPRGGDPTMYVTFCFGNLYLEGLHLTGSLRQWR